MSIETVPWDEFYTRLRWNQGEHIAAIAPTGAGKTTLLDALIDKRTCSLFLGTKPDDKMYRALIAKRGFKRVERVSEIRPWENRILLWPKQRKTIDATTRAQSLSFREAFDMVVNQKAWTLWVDECKYMSEELRLTRQLTYCLEQLRSIKGTVISGSQRPRWLPRSVLSNASHVFLWKTTDPDDLKRLTDIGGLDRNLIKQEAGSLGKHEFIYIYTRGTEVQTVRSQVRI